MDNYASMIRIYYKKLQILILVQAKVVLPKNKCQNFPTAHPCLKFTRVENNFQFDVNEYELCSELE